MLKPTLKLTALLLAAAAMLCSCSDSGSNPGGDDPTNEEEDVNSTPTAPADLGKYVGADLSQLLVYLENGAVYTENGHTINDVPAYFVSKGFNIARLRLFVNPDKNTEACQDLDLVLRTAKVCAQAGMQICIDFHYSDTWADPAKQYTPAAWESLSASQLASAVYNYTRTSLKTLVDNGIVPAQIQIGNEITGGMLWENGHVSVWENDANYNETRWSNFLSYLQNASKACREVTPGSKIIIHIDRGGDKETTQRFYTRVADIDYDIIGLSYYPFWHGTLNQLETNIVALKRAFPDKKVMIVETAFPNVPSDYEACEYEFNSDGKVQYLNDLVTMLKRNSNVTGVYYWYPEETLISPFKGRIDLHRGLFDEYTGEVLPSIDCLKAFSN